MLTRLRAGLSYANVMATAAVFIALGGIGYAATARSADTVGSAQITNGSVHSADLGAGS